MSSQLPDIEWSTTATQLTVALWDANGDTRFIEVTLTAVDGKVRLWEVREAVEQRMRDQNEQRMNMRVQWKEPSTSSWSSQGVAVHYCDAEFDGDAATWLQAHFLTTQAWKPLPVDGRTEKLSFYEATVGTDVAPTVLVVYSLNGAVTSQTITPSEQVLSLDSVMTHSWTLDDIVEQMTLEEGENPEILALSISIGNRMMSYYRALEPTIVMGFRNCFNVDEWVELHAATTRKIKDERKQAMVSRKAVNYDLHRVVEYEVQTAPLTYAHALWIDQLLTSHKVWLADGSEVVITDGEANVTDDNAATNTVKFTWRRATGRAQIVVQETDQIFTEEYSQQYS